MASREALNICSAWTEKTAKHETNVRAESDQSSNYASHKHTRKWNAKQAAAVIEGDRAHEHVTNHVM